MSIQQFPREKADSYLIDDGSVDSSKIKQKAITTAKIDSINGSKIGELPEQKLIDDAVTVEKLPHEIRAGINNLPQDNWMPILRFFRWYNHSSGRPFSIPNYDSAFMLKSLLGIENPGYTSKYFLGVEYARLRSTWIDDNNQLQSYSGVYYANNMSVICLKNTSDSPQTINPNIYYSSYSSSDYAKADLAVLNNIRFNANGEPNSSDLSNASNVSVLWTNTSSAATSAVAGTVTVPAGQGVVFLLKTCAQYFSGSSNSYNYHNLHGFFNLCASSCWAIKSKNTPSNPFEVCYELYEAVINRNN